MSELHRQISVAIDAFSSGQVGSKVWLAQILEKLVPAYGHSEAHTIWIYGGWQGVLGFILLSRQGAQSDFLIERVRSFDLDAEATAIANILNENWVWREWQFRAFTADCNLIFRESERAGNASNAFRQENTEFGLSPTIVINTSVEHFSERLWFENLPKGTIVALQASDFEHEGVTKENRDAFASDQAFARAFSMSEHWFSGSLSFEYGESGSNWSFQRRMLIGRK